MNNPLFLGDPGFVEAPEWTKDLIIYEINPYAFTSPKGAGDGSGSGTFNSLREKLAYLEDPGITGIWLAGFNTCTTHFYGIKTVYACVRPDEIDPALGTSAEFKAMIDEAHGRGIRIFLDAITHGIVDGSPLITEHPDWFKGGTWGMTDYDYENAEFRAWWVKLWTSYVLEYGIDGYRLDVPRYDQIPLWNTIAGNCRDAGHPIIIFPELTAMYHFVQRDYIGFSNDMAGEFNPLPQYVGGQISCHDDGWISGPGNYYKVKGHRANLAYAMFGYNIPIFMAGEEFNAEQVSLPNLAKGLYGEGGPGGWLYGSWIQWDQLNEKTHRDMLNDFRKVMRIKRENKDILHADRSATQILRVRCTPPCKPMPYVRFLAGQKAIVVVANSSHDEAETNVFTLDIPLADMGLGGKGRYRVTDLWTNAISTVMEAELHNFRIAVPSAYVVNGGARALKIELMDLSFR